MTPFQEDRRRADVTFEGFHDQWYRRGVGYAMRAFCLNVHDAEEAVSDAMAAVHASWGGINQPAAYFRVVLQRRAVDILRKLIRRETHESQVSDAELTGDDALAEEVREALATVITPETLYLQGEQNRLILNVLDELPLHFRVSLVLAAEGYSTKERAAIKDVAEGTERSHLTRARTHFERLLLKHGLPLPRPNTKDSEPAKEEEGQ
ncbi:RNA polymerase sigma factor [Streptomyces sp. NPDC088770]|uniref:RNA polymerase sigma factor n=1 Tax=unclassified Streptomyces TaxID=2593676 RepID=UPI00380C6419